MPESWRPLGRTGLTVSAVGFGGNRVHPSVDESAAAMRMALWSGCNLVDTSPSYGDGGSETLVGDVLASVRSEGRRDEVVVVSKGGSIRGSRLDAARRREARGAFHPETVEHSDSCWHCIHPSFLVEEIQESLDRLQLDSIDVYLLENPENFLSAEHPAEGGAAIGERREELYERLGRAFACLEAQVAAGLIGSYGISCSTLGSAAESPDFVSLDRILELAEEAGGAQCSFSTVQVPLNLLERGPALVRNSGPDRQRTALERARDAGVAVLAVRPLDAMARCGSVRLADFDAGTGELRAARLLRAAARIEDEFSEGLAQVLDFGATDGTTLFRFSRQLVEDAVRFDDVAGFTEYVRDDFGPELSRIAGHLDRALDGPIKAAWQLWLERYAAAIAALADVLRLRIARRCQRRSNHIARILADGLPPAVRGDSLSRKAIGLVLSCPGITSVLVGMHQRRYVEDALGVMGWPPFEAEPALFETVSAKGAP